MDFSQMLQQQANLTSSNDNEQSFVQTKKPSLVINKKNPEVIVRILPLGNNYFATSYRVIFLKLHKKDGSVIRQMVRFPVRNDMNVTDKQFDEDLMNRDPLFKAVKEAISIEQKEKGALDLNTNPSYGFNMRERHTIAVVPIDMRNRAMATGQDGRPDIRLLQLSNPAYNGILNQVMGGNYTLPNNQPFPNELSFISEGPTYPVQITLNDTNYNISVRPDIMLAPMNEDYLLRDSNDEDYAYFDDPYRFSKSSFEELGGTDENSYYNYILNQVQEKLDNYKNANNIVTGSSASPYVAGSNPYSNQAPVNPYSASQQPSVQVSAGQTNPVQQQQPYGQSMTSGYNQNNYNQQSAPMGSTQTPQPSTTQPPVQPQPSNSTGYNYQAPTTGQDTFDPSTGDFNGGNVQSTTQTTQYPQSPVQPQQATNNQEMNGNMGSQAPASQAGMPNQTPSSVDSINNGSFGMTGGDDMSIDALIDKATNDL